MTLSNSMLLSECILNQFFFTFFYFTLLIKRQDYYGVESHNQLCLVPQVCSIYSVQQVLGVCSLQTPLKLLILFPHSGTIKTAECARCFEIYLGLITSATQHEARPCTGTNVVYYIVIYYITW